MVIGANVLVMIGAILQAVAKRSKQMWVIVLGRLFLGFGGEITPFTTVEILGRLFHDYSGLMAGVRNLVQSLSGFLAFVLLPIWAEAVDDQKKEQVLRCGCVLCSVSLVCSPALWCSSA